MNSSLRFYSATIKTTNVSEIEEYGPSAEQLAVVVVQASVEVDAGLARGASGVVAAGTEDIAAADVDTAVAEASVGEDGDREHRSDKDSSDGQGEAHY